MNVELSKDFAEMLNAVSKMNQTWDYSQLIYARISEEVRAMTIRNIAVRRVLVKTFFDCKEFQN